MAAIISVFIIAAISLIIVRVGASALMMTGLSWDTANFQAYSAFFGVGFTTSESEMVVNHPVRRRIIRHLILAGHLVVSAGLGSLVVAFVKAEGTRGELLAAARIALGLALIWLISSTPMVRRAMDWVIRRTLRTSGVTHAMDYALLLRVHAGFCISEFEVESGNWLVGKKLLESKLGSRGVVVLGIEREGVDGGYIGTPTGSTVVHVGDVLTVYGLEGESQRILEGEN